MATVTFYGGGGPYSIGNLLGSGLAFYGSSANSSVAVGEYQDTTFVASAAGIAGNQINNVKYVNSMSGQINGASAILMKRVPNYLSTLNIRFTHDTSVRLQNSKIRIYDRSNINNDPSGVTCKVYECIKTDVDQGVDGSGANTWSTVRGSAVILDLGQSPGISGYYNHTGSTHQAAQHDYYLALSASPNSVGSKSQFGLYFSTEYL